MSDKYPGGFVTLTPPTLNPALGAATPGIWTLDQAMSAAQTRSWPMYDPYYKNVVLNLHGEGTNGAQNNTFLDSSTNNFTITRNGNTTQGSFSPYGSLWSNSLNGSGSCVSAASNAAFGFGTGDYTVEGWFYLNSLTTSGGITSNAFLWDMRNGSGSTVAGTLVLDNSTFIPRYEIAGSAAITGSSAFVASQWTHVAVSRVSGTTRMFINGVQSGSNYTDSNNYVTCPVFIGRDNDTNQNRYLNGYVSNFRIVKGTGLYSSGFTPSTVPLTAIANTSLLTCQSNRFIDNSSNAFSITVTGSPSVQRFSPFNPTSAYSTSVIGGSGYFDGSGDYLKVSPDQTVGANPFTFECWYYCTGAYGSVYTLFGNDSLATTGAFSLRINSSTQIAIDRNNVSATNFTVPTLGSNTWNHIVAVRDSSNNETVFVNGVRSTTGVVTDSYTYQFFSTVGYLNSTYTQYCQGYICDARVVIGSTVYSPLSSNITVPTSPLTAVTNTKLLLSMTNAGIYDNAMMNDLETVGNAQISTSVKKYGTGSMAFDGTGDYLTTLNTANLSFGTGDFSIECWWYPTDLSASTNLWCLGNSASAQNGLTAYWSSASSTLRVWSNGATIITGTISTSVNSWYHIAVVRSGTTLVLYVNGVSAGSATNSTSFTGVAANGFCINAEYAGSFSAGKAGYIDDLRITKGVARYVANFTPPTSQLQDQ